VGLPKCFLHLLAVSQGRLSRICRGGRTSSDFHRYDQPLKLRHLPILSYLVYVRIRPKRFRYLYCVLRKCSR
jgi:hypothetical protein